MAEAADASSAPLTPIAHVLQHAAQMVPFEVAVVATRTPNEAGTWKYHWRRGSDSQPDNVAWPLRLHRAAVLEAHTHPQASLPQARHIPFSSTDVMAYLLDLYNQQPQTRRGRALPDMPHVFVFDPSGLWKLQGLTPRGKDAFVRTFAGGRASAEAFLELGGTALDVFQDAVVRGDLGVDEYVDAVRNLWGTKTGLMVSYLDYADLPPEPWPLHEHDV